MNEPAPVTPWYKQFWPWFLISLPMSAVIASMITINLAITDVDGLVKDDHYKQGLAINQDKARKHMAENLGVQAQTIVDINTGTIKTILNDAAIGNLDKLQVNMIHPTRVNNDMSIILDRMDTNTYTGKFSMSVKPGYWWVRLSPENDSWYIEGRIRLPEDQSLVLK